MSEINKEERDLFMKRIFQNFMEEQFNEMKENHEESNNSFMFLEKSTLNILLMNMLMHDKNAIYGVVKRDDEMMVLEELEKLIVESKMQFEEIIEILKQRK